MGNCIIKDSAMQWGGEDWRTSLARESNISDHRTRNRRDFYCEAERTSLLGASSSPKAAGRKVKIRISKKQLEDFLKNSDEETLSAQEFLARLRGAGDRFEAHRRPWTPALQSIPE